MTTTPSSITELILIRHGETDWNRVKRIQGNTDIALNATGIAQAQRLGRRLAHERIDAVIASDLLRAQQTAGIVAEAIDREVTLEAGLRERRFGIFEGLTADEIALRYPAEFARWRARDPEFALPEGESLRTFHERIREHLTRIAQRHATRRIVIISHGGVLDCAYRLATGMPLGAPRIQSLLNASLNRLGFDAATGTFSLLQWGDAAHLDTPALDEADKRAV